MGTCAYILDTGIDATHPDFGGRASQVANFVDSATTDGNGHGTHLAGIIGGEVHGVAKQTTLLGVKVLSDSGSGSTSGIIAGMGFVTDDSATRSCPNGVVVNMSIGGAYSTALNAAAAALVDGGSFVSVSAGNSNDDAGNYSPASEPSVCTVGASDRSDNVGGISNYGAALDVFAPGRGIPSTWIDGGVVSLSRFHSVRARDISCEIVVQQLTVSSEPFRARQWQRRTSLVWPRIWAHWRASRAEARVRGSRSWRPRAS